MRTLSILLSAACLISCSTLTNQQKRMITTFAGASVGATLGNITARKSDKADKNATIWANTAIGTGIGFAAGEYFYGEEDYSKLSEELSAYKAMDRNQGRYILKDTLVRGPQRIKCPGSNRVAKVLCTNSSGKLSDCEDTGFLYLNSNWAVQFIAFYSPEGCYPPPYDKERYLNSYFKSIESEILEK